MLLHQSLLTNQSQVSVDMDKQARRISSLTSSKLRIIPVRLSFVWMIRNLVQGFWLMLLTQQNVPSKVVALAVVIVASSSSSTDPITTISQIPLAKSGVSDDTKTRMYYHQSAKHLITSDDMFRRLLNDKGAATNSILLPDLEPQADQHSVLASNVVGVGHRKLKRKLNTDARAAKGEEMNRETTKLEDASLGIIRGSGSTNVVSDGIHDNNFLLDEADSLARHSSTRSVSHNNLRWPRVVRCSEHKRNNKFVASGHADGPSVALGYEPSGASVEVEHHEPANGRAGAAKHSNQLDNQFARHQQLCNHLMPTASEQFIEHQAKRSKRATIKRGNVAPSDSSWNVKHGNRLLNQIAASDDWLRDSKLAAAVTSTSHQLQLSANHSESSSSSHKSNSTAQIPLAYFSSSSSSSSESRGASVAWINRQPNPNLSGLRQVADQTADGCSRRDAAFDAVDAATTTSAGDADAAAVSRLVAQPELDAMHQAREIRQAPGASALHSLALGSQYNDGSRQHFVVVGVGQTVINRGKAKKRYLEQQRQRNVANEPADSREFSNKKTNATAASKQVDGHIKSLDSSLIGCNDRGLPSSNCAIKPVRKVNSVNDDDYSNEKSHTSLKIIPSRRTADEIDYATKKSTFELERKYLLNDNFEVEDRRHSHNNRQRYTKHPIQAKQLTNINHKESEDRITKAAFDRARRFSHVAQPSEDQAQEERQRPTGEQRRSLKNDKRLLRRRRHRQTSGVEEQHSRGITRFFAVPKRAHFASNTNFDIKKIEIESSTSRALPREKKPSDWLTSSKNNKQSTRHWKHHSSTFAFDPTQTINELKHGACKEKITTTTTTDRSKHSRNNKLVSTRAKTSSTSFIIHDQAKREKLDLGDSGSLHNTSCNCELRGPSDSSCRDSSETNESRQINHSFKLLSIEPRNKSNSNRTIVSSQNGGHLNNHRLRRRRSNQAISNTSQLSNQTEQRPIDRVQPVASSSWQQNQFAFNEELIELLAQFYGYTEELQDKIDRYLANRLHFAQKNNPNQAKSRVSDNQNSTNSIVSPPVQSAKNNQNIETALSTAPKSNSTNLPPGISEPKTLASNTTQFNTTNTSNLSLTQKAIPRIISNLQQNSIKNNSQVQINSRFQLSKTQYSQKLSPISRYFAATWPAVYQRIKMHFGADDESLLKWFRAKQDQYSTLKNISIELISEPPERAINVCLDGPKIWLFRRLDGNRTLNDIFYCYTHDQWIEKLWLDWRPSPYHYPLLALNILIFLFGATGNIFVCLSVYRNHQLRNVTNYHIVNLAVADLLVIIICLPATSIWDVSLTWFFGTIPCKLIMYLQDVSISVSVLTLAAISIDRYYAICYPLRFKSSLSRAKRVICCIWLFSLTIMLPDLVYLAATQSLELSEAGLNTVLYSDCNYTWSEQSSRLFQYVKTILLYFLPFVFMFAAHFRIMRTLRKSTASSSTSAGSSAPPTDASQQQQANSKSCTHNNNKQPKQRQEQNLSTATFREQAKPILVPDSSVCLTLESPGTSSEIARDQQQASDKLFAPSEGDQPQESHQANKQSDSADPKLDQLCLAADTNNQKTTNKRLRRVTIHAGSPVELDGGVLISQQELTRQLARTTSENNNDEMIVEHAAPKLPIKVSVSSDSDDVAKVTGDGGQVSTTGEGMNDKQARTQKVDELTSRDEQEHAENSSAIRTQTSPELESGLVVDSLPMEGSMQRRKSCLATTANNVINKITLAEDQRSANVARGFKKRNSIIGAITFSKDSNASQLVIKDVSSSSGKLHRTSSYCVAMHNKSQLDSRRNAAKMLMAIVIFFGITHLPVHLMNFLRHFIEDLPQNDFTLTISMLAHSLCHLNSAINPIIYNYMNSVFRAEFRKTLSFLLCSTRANERQETYVTRQASMRHQPRPELKFKVTLDNGQLTIPNGTPPTPQTNKQARLDFA